MEAARYYTVATAGYFPGLVALLNSLRLTGNDQELVVLDAGLTPEQRSRLEAHVTLVELPELGERLPMLKKIFPELLSPTDTVVLIDSDMIVTGSLEPQLAEAAAGRLVLFPDHESMHDRWFPEWESAFQLSAPPRKQTYLNTGFVALSPGHWPDLLARWRRACELIPPERVAVAPGLMPRKAVMEREPFWAADQDAMNAILMSELPEDAVAVQPIGAEPDWLGEVEVLDETTLECRYRGEPTLILHLSLTPKPWESKGWRRAERNAYVQLLPRLLLGDDVTLRLDPAELPVWLRRSVPGRLALATLDGRRRTLDALERAARGSSQRLPAPVRKRVLGLRDRLAASLR